MSLAKPAATWSHVAGKRQETARSGSSAIDAVIRSLEHSRRTGGGVLAGAVAFRTFTFMVPFAFVFVSGFGLASDISGRSTDDIARGVGAGGLMARAMVNAQAGSHGSRIAVFVGAGLALIIAARAELKVLRTVHALIWQVPLPKLAKPTRAVLIVIGSVVVWVALFLGTAMLRERSFIVGIPATVLFTLVPTAGWLYASWKAFPHAEGAGWQDFLPGALLVGIGTQLLHVVTVLFIAREVTSQTEAYGAIGVALAILLWAYLLGRIFTASAVLNLALWERTHPVRPPA